MLLKDFLANAVLRGTNQRLPSNLLGTPGLLSYINFALDDMYTFEGKYRTWMYDKIELDCTVAEFAGKEVVYVDVPFPLLRVLYIEDATIGTSLYDTTLERTGPYVNQFEALNLEPIDKIDPHNYYFKPHKKRIFLRNNNSKYVIHYLHYFDQLDYTETTELPIPDVFTGALYNLTMGYIYPNYGQQGENKESNAWQKAKQQLTDLAKTDSFQMTGVWGNKIH